MGDNKRIKALAEQAQLMPQEELLAVQKRKNNLTISIPKETSFQEKRVALTPEAVGLLVNNGHIVLVEASAGKESHFSDTDYSEAGAQIVHEREKIFQSEIIFKVAPPSLEEVKMMSGNQFLFSALQMTLQPKESLEVLMKKKVTAIAWDYIKDSEDIYPVVRAMGEIAGNTSVLIASEYLSNANNGQGLMFGGISGVHPTEVVIIGAGTVGAYASKASLGMGCSVKIFDNSLFKLRRLQNDVGHRLWTSTIQPKILAEALKNADVAIGALSAPFGRTPCVVSEAMIENMPSGSVLVDVSIDQGGVFETSRITNHDHPTFKHHDVIHYCVPNIASRVSKTASYALSNIFAPVLIEMGNEGGADKMIKGDPGFREGVYMFKGCLTNQIIGELFDLPWKNLGLLVGAI